MSVPGATRIVVLGLGNLIRTDDGLGIHAIQQLRTAGGVSDGVDLIDGGTLGLDLLPVVEGATHVLVIDAIDSGSPPGSLVRYDIADLEPLPCNPSVHLIGFSDMLAGLHLLGKFPQQIVLLGLQPANTDWGEQLTPELQVAVPMLLEAATHELQQWAVAGACANNRN